jgi:hypothetical protein
MLAQSSESVAVGMGLHMVQAAAQIGVAARQPQHSAETRCAKTEKDGLQSSWRFRTPRTDPSTTLAPIHSAMRMTERVISEQDGSEHAESESEADGSSKQWRR